MDRDRILDNILNRGSVRLRVEELIPGPAITYEYQDISTLEDKINTFLEILEQEEKSEKWASGITTYQISRFRQYPADDGFFHLVSADPQSFVLQKTRSFCTICLTDIKKGEIVRELPCFHKFHKKCVDYWLKQKAVCPVDRRSMLED
jgi:Ring finger domain